MRHFRERTGTSAAVVLLAALVLSTPRTALSGSASPLVPGANAVVVAPAETLVVTLAGEGETVVLIPGLFGSAYGFRKLVPLMNQAGFRTLIIEPLGVGHSSRPPVADYSLTAQADRIAHILERFEIPPAVVVAHSIGASQALRMAYRHPERVRGVVLLDGGPAETAASPGLTTAMKLAGIVKAIAGEGLIRGRLKSQLRNASFDDSWITEEAVDNYTAGVMKDFGAAVEAFGAMARAVEEEALEPNLPRVRAPVELLLGGAPHDYALPPEELGRLRAGLPDFQSLSVPGCGHYIHEEQPAVIVISVRRVLRRASAAPAEP